VRLRVAPVSYSTAALVPASAHSGQERDSAPIWEFLLADQLG
jgi:hypothetical protein